MNTSNDLISHLRDLNLTTEQAKLYLELLRGPNTHLRLAHATGINRTKIYRLAQDLEKRSLITKRSDDRGTFLVAADPATLEVELVSEEGKIKTARQAFDQLTPLLATMLGEQSDEFVVHTYHGPDGFKQMLWHELKTKGDNVIFGNGTIDDLVDDERWAEKHRAMTVQTNYNVRELLNPDSKDPIFTLNKDFIDKHYSARYVSPKLLMFRQQIAIYNNTVSIYSWKGERKVGLEIINKSFANTMRQNFEHYWQLANPVEKDVA